MRPGALLLLIAALCSAPAAAAQDDPAAAAAEPRIALALTEDLVQVTARFVGARIVLYGAASDLAPGDDIVVALRGPDRRVRATRKVRSGPIWVNAAPVEFAGAPSFYAAASTRPLEEIAPRATLRRLGIGPEYASLRAIGAAGALASGQIQDYRQAIVRLKSARGLYAADPRGVEIFDEGLFRAVATVPAGAPTGPYIAEAFLFRDGRLAARREAFLSVDRAGLDRWIYNLAHGASLAYGLLAVTLAVGAGWAAAFAFRRV